MTDNQQWIYAKRPEGEVTHSNYKLVECPVPEAKEGQLLVKALYISVDPYHRIQQASTDTWEKPHPLNTVQGSGVVGRVENEPKGTDFKKGDIVEWYGGWQLYGVCDANKARKIDPSLGPISTAIGVLGMPGRTAYFSFLEAGKPKAGETVVVSAAAGAVGSTVAQIAKIKGCRVVGIAGSPEKCDFLVKKLGLDAAINYKEFNTQEKMSAEFKRVCPGGIDIYYDNVGGYISDAVYPLINLRARIIICGQITQYNGQLDEPELGPRFLHHILYKRATIQGILSRDYEGRMDEMVAQMGQWLKEGKLQAVETTVEGFENVPDALNSLFHGKNIGKLVVKVADL